MLGIIDRETLTAIFRREADRLHLRFGVKEDRITSLSGGNQQKVLIGRGFAMRPEVIVLNDPARGIDVSAKFELYRHLRDFARDGRSVVYLSSEIEEFAGFATRVLVFRNGAPFDAFDGRQIEAPRVLEAMFGQTDGSGLAGGPGDTTAGAAHVDVGGRVRVEVPPALRPVRSQPVSPEPAAAVLNQRSGPRIRIVEFDADGRRRDRSDG